MRLLPAVQLSFSVAEVQLTARLWLAMIHLSVSANYVEVAFQVGQNENSDEFVAQTELTSEGNVEIILLVLIAMDFLKAKVEHLLNGKERDNPGHLNHRPERWDSPLQGRDLCRRSGQRRRQRKQGTPGWEDILHSHRDPSHTARS